MSEKTRQLVIVIAAVVVGVLVILFALALYQGIASIPGEVQTAAWGLLIAAIGAGSVYLNTRSNAATRENSNRNAQQTQARIAEVSSELHDGLKEEFGKTAADMVNQHAEVVAAKLASELVASAPLATSPVLREIAANTAETAANTAALSDEAKS